MLLRTNADQGHEDAKTLLKEIDPQNIVDDLSRRRQKRN